MYEHYSDALRFVGLAPYRVGRPTFTLETFDCGPAEGLDAGKNIVGYRFTEHCPDGSQVVLWDRRTRATGADFIPGRSAAIDSNEVLVSLLVFLTCKPGDTDQDYFKRYTEAQLAFANEHGEALSLLMDDQGNAIWTNMDGWEDD